MTNEVTSFQLDNYIFCSGNIFFLKKDGLYYVPVVNKYAQNLVLTISLIPPEGTSIFNGALDVAAALKFQLSAFFLALLTINHAHT